MQSNQTVYIVDRLQKALDDRDIGNINKFMALVFNDYDKNYINVLLDYNLNCNIQAIDLLNFKYLHPRTSFRQIFCFQPNLVKALCYLDDNLKWVNKS